MQNHRLGLIITVFAAVLITALTRFSILSLVLWLLAGAALVFAILTAMGVRLEQDSWKTWVAYMDKRLEAIIAKLIEKEYLANIAHTIRPWASKIKRSLPYVMASIALLSALMVLLLKSPAEYAAWLKATVVLATATVYPILVQSIVDIWLSQEKTA